MNILQILFQTCCEVFYLFLGITGSNSFPRRLTPAEEAQYIAELQTGSQSARAALIEHNLRLVAHICKKYFSNPADNEDMVSVGTIGLIKAVDSFMPEKGTRFSSYAARCIENECLMYLRAAKKVSQNVSINDPIETDKHGNELTFLDVVAGDDTIAEDLERKLQCERLRGIISEEDDSREAQIIRLRYGTDGSEPLTQKEIAAMLGISRSYVSRIEKRALDRLRDRF